MTIQSWQHEAIVAAVTVDLKLFHFRLVTGFPLLRSGILPPLNQTTVLGTPPAYVHGQYSHVTWK